MLASYDPATGRLGHKLETSDWALVQDLELVWDALGNLQERHNFYTPERHSERFGYDTRDRLTRVEHSTDGGASWAVTQRLRYDVSGNILCKSGTPGSAVSCSSSTQSNYGYQAQGPHAVSQAGNRSFTYDANGNVTEDRVAGFFGGSQADRSFSYTSFDLLRKGSRGATAVEFHYGPDRARTLRVDRSSGAIQRRVHYVGSVEVVWNGSSPSAGQGEYRRYIGGVVLATFYAASGVDRQRYLHTDHLGSIVAISDENGWIESRTDFDAWGQRRSASDWSDTWRQWLMGQTPVWASYHLDRTDRGYTGHEHVDALGIIHMNGRIYDPVQGRFLQADPLVEDQTTLNRYSYVHNNPLGYTDPSGYLSLSLKTVFQIALTVYTGGAAGGFWNFFGIALKTTNMALGAVMATGAVTGAMDGGVQGALQGAFAAAVFFGIGQDFAGTAGAGNGIFGSGYTAGELLKASVVHGVAGGVLAEMQGGGFGHGFISAGLSKALTPAAMGVSDNVFVQGALVAIVGGTTSELSGGKFANGAVTSAMGFAFNQVAHRANSARMAGKIYVTGHRVSRIGPYHLAVEYVDDESGPHWISAGPKDGLLVSGQDEERPTDKPDLNETIGEIIPPSGMKARDYFQRLKQADFNYCDCIDYDLFPGIADSYNSNSYISGLIQATGGASTVDFDEFVGGSKPLPARYFERP